ncbi:MAG: hypothetical protein OQL19_00335 [Gammaproteobacteria bacterium]|nr:hypothetical protein [Gammaproteobacteria bacterium]
MLLISAEANAAGTLSERNYKKLQTIHKLIEKNQLAQAKKQLDQFLSKKHTAYTQAIFLQTAAHVALEQIRYDKAITYLEQADSLKALPDFVSQNIIYNLAQLYFQRASEEKKTAKSDLNISLKMLVRWLDGNTRVSSEQHIFIATVYARLKKYQSTIKHVNRAIKLSQKNAKKPKESWYQLLISSHLEQKQYKQAINAYKIVIKLYPGNKSYWKQLSGLYLQTNEIHQALAVLELANKQGMLSTEKELLRLANLYLYANIPLSATTLLQKNLDSGIIQPTIKNWLKLSDAWIMAQEYTQAIEILKHIAQLDELNGQYQFRAGRLYMEQAKWLMAYQQFKLAQNKKLSDPGQNFLLQGISAYYAKMPEKAQKAFEKASKFKKYKDKSELWLEQLDFYAQ